ncbi:DUF924 family protein [Pseudomarimonas arenosa]|uniref:DUF924 domain-containing protein n=1 Tax=Pseudomarimonas arenosa TaxID=2774145 RepID=A0AAW3ZPP5_9GAMM|nr:DUF924 family protein [Pseudomarimonas arenosa]MBD8526266.1 DUF924 domain-containing protein [Pseudomarimonas arenosa]
MAEAIEQILNYWFGDHADDVTIAKSQASLWWGKNAEVDADIGQRFGALVPDAEAGRLSDWQTSPRGLLALILLTDQFPRNVYRDQAMAFHFDPVARWFCLEGLMHGVDRRLRPIQRAFFYLPLEHAEDLALQNRSVELFEALVSEVPAAAQSTFKGYLDFARQHQRIIQRFGRFPHRNAVLGRASTEQELDFLQQPGSSF